MPWASVARSVLRWGVQPFFAVQVSVNDAHAVPSVGDVWRSMKSNMPAQRPSHAPRGNGAVPSSAMLAWKVGTASVALLVTVTHACHGRVASVQESTDEPGN